MAEHLILVVDPMEELPEVLRRFAGWLRWVEADTDEANTRLGAAVEDVGTLSDLLRPERFTLRAPGGTELAPLATLPSCWRPTLDKYGKTGLSGLAPNVPDAAVAAFDQLRRCAAWSERPEAELLSATLARPGRRLTQVEYEAYVGLVRATLDDPLERWAALGPSSTRSGQPSAEEDLPGRPDRPEWRL